MNILVWHVHGSWTTGFVQGRHTYLLPVLPDRGPDGRGRARTWDWPPSAVEVDPADLADADVDVVIVQRPGDEALARRWLGGRRPGRDVPVVWLEHNAPQGRIADMRHPAADRDDVLVVHVTPTNALYWDCGSTPTRVVEHGVPDPGERYTGTLAAAVSLVNEPLRRGRVVGADVLARVAARAPIDVYGMGTAEFAAAIGAGGGRNLPQDLAHDALARHRVYVHSMRWTSLGLALIEAMLLGMPVVALGTTEAPLVVPPAAGVVTNRVEEVCDAVCHFLHDPFAARRAGEAARAAALDRFGLDRFLADWDDILEEVVV